MEIAQSIIDAATAHLDGHGSKNLPIQLDGSPFYLAERDDRLIMAFGVLKHESVEYKIGVLRQSPCGLS